MWEDAAFLPRAFQLALCRRNDERRVVAAAAAAEAASPAVAVGVVVVVVVAPPQLDRGRAGGGVRAEAGVLENVLKDENSILYLKIYNGKEKKVEKAPEWMGRRRGPKPQWQPTIKRILLNILLKVFLGTCSL